MSTHQIFAANSGAGLGWKSCLCFLHNALMPPKFLMVEPLMACDRVAICVKARSLTKRADYICSANGNRTKTMQLKFDWLIVLENLKQGVMVTDVTLDAPKGPRIIYVNRAWLKMTGYGRDQVEGKTPRILQGKHTDRAVVGSLKEKLLNREVFHGQTWNYRKSGEPFLMNWYCYSIYVDRPKPVYYVAEQQDVTELEGLRMKQRLIDNPYDAQALDFFAVLEEWKAKRKKGR
jgi:PAS domain S-box-containing protein